MANSITFEKMHGIGNDFVLIDNRSFKIKLDTTSIKKLANRHTGIGFDQLIIIESPPSTEFDASYRFFNPDGSEAEQCGNGQRCISYYLSKQSPEKKSFHISGLAGAMQSTIHNNGQISVEMGYVQEFDVLSIAKSACYFVNFGNPHLVVVKENISSCDLEKLKNKYTSQYPQGINFELSQIIDKKTIKLRVHERGTGETLACGSGACAAVFALHSNGLLDDKVEVQLPGGVLTVEVSLLKKTIYLTGPAAHVFTGEISL